ncbi:MAG: resuscitation-promoting factor RpfA, partial [Acidimicrobiaceae bacterium]|nr:resuscitation-promoting factor RpfA [Acidimicrobiaceae bacterium]
VAGSASLTRYSVRSTAWRLSHARYARVSKFRYRLVPIRATKVATGDVWQRLRACESGNSYTRNSGNGYFGAYQFSASTWHSLGYAGLPHQADAATQDAAAQKLLARSGWGQWPACSRAIGAR